MLWYPGRKMEGGDGRIEGHEPMNARRWRGERKERKREGDEKSWKEEGEKINREIERRKEEFRRHFAENRGLLNTFEREGILILVEPVRGNPSAEFKCSNCRYFCNSFDAVLKHIKETWHTERVNWAKTVNTAKLIKRYVGRNQIEICIESILDERLLTAEDLKACTTAVLEVERLVLACGAGGGAVEVGSVPSLLGARGLSDTNVEVADPEPGALRSLAQRIDKAGLETVFDPHFPKIRFDHPLKGHGKVTVTVEPKERAVNLTLLFKRYHELDSRTSQLCCLMRVWAEETGLIHAIPHHAFYLLVIFYLQDLPVPVLPVLKDHNDNSNGDWSSENRTDLATLWIELFRFYSVDFNGGLRWVVVGPPSDEEGRRSGWLSVDDPSTPHPRSLLGHLPSDWSEWAAQAFSSTFTYFALPQTKQGPAFGALRPEPQFQYLDIEEVEEYAREQKRYASCLVRLVPFIDSNYKEPTQEEELKLEFLWEELKRLPSGEDHTGLGLNHILSQLSNPIARGLPAKNRYQFAALTPSEASFLVKSLDPSALFYDFTKENLTAGSQPPESCPWCREPGGVHPGGRCPPPPGWGDALEGEVAWESLARALVPPLPPDAVLRREAALHLQAWLEKHFKKGVRVHLFGSSASGFGTAFSDMDVCLTFEGNPNGQNLDEQDLVKKLYGTMRRHGGKDFLPTEYVLHAKVPIVKFTHLKTCLQGDISFYNLLALTNTQMLFTYCQINWRVRGLVMALKKLASMADMGDASKGGLSSYSFTLMVLAFLMRTRPAVLPCLQQLGKTNAPATGKPDTYFFQDLDNLNEVWPGWELAREDERSLGRLWMEMLAFYTREFDFLREVVTVRTAGQILKMDLSWSSRCIAIEDPFEDRNLASGISFNMSRYILKVFNKAYLHFSSQQAVGMPPSYFWNRKVFDQEPTPTRERRCYRCRVSGHGTSRCLAKKQRNQ